MSLRIAEISVVLINLTMKLMNYGKCVCSVSKLLFLRLAFLIKIHLICFLIIFLTLYHYINCERGWIVWIRNWNINFCLKFKWNTCSFELEFVCRWGFSGEFWLHWLAWFCTTELGRFSEGFFDVKQIATTIYELVNLQLKYLSSENALPDAFEYHFGRYCRVHHY